MRNLLISLAFIFALVISSSTITYAQTDPRDIGSSGGVTALGGITHIYPLQIAIGHGNIRGLTRTANPSNIIITILDNTGRSVKRYESSYSSNHQFTIPEGDYNSLQPGVHILILSIDNLESGRVEFTIE